MRANRKIASIVCGVLFVAGAVASGNSAQAAESASLPEGYSELVVSLNQTADALTKVGENDFAASFGGVEFNPSATGLIVHMVAPTDAIEASLLKAASADPATITWDSASRTYASLLALNDRISAQFDALAAQGVVTTGIGPGLREVVSVHGLTDELTAQIHSELAPDVQVVEAGADGQTASRLSDVAPWYGGDFLSGPGASGGTEGCSSGFGVHWISGGNNYIVTAGHCYPLSATVKDGYNGTSMGSFGTIGSVTNRTYNGGALDAELIQTNSGSKVWTGGTTTSSSLTMNQIGNPYSGMPFCADGAYEGEHCSATVYSINGCATFDSGTLSACGLSYFYGTDSQTLGHGDSGGPSYITTGGVTYAVGILEAVQDVTTCTNWASIETRTCGHNGWFTQLNSIASQWNLSLS